MAVLPLGAPHVPMGRSSPRAALQAPAGTLVRGRDGARRAVLWPGAVPGGMQFVGFLHFGSLRQNNMDKVVKVNNGKQMNSA